MLEESAFGSFSVKDIKEAQEFYGKTLGLDVEEVKMPEGMELLRLKFKNGTEFLIYPKPDHQPATHTVLNFEVEDVSKVVRELKRKGIRFEHYDGNDEDEVSRSPEHEAAWFKDPAGNFLSVMSH